MNGALQIGEVAKRAGVSIDTLRYYERSSFCRGLHGPPVVFDSLRLCILAVRFIKQAPELGFSLEEIKGLLTTGGADECRKVRELLHRKLSELDDRLKAMKRFRRLLARQLAECDQELKQHGKSACCPVLPVKDAKN